MSKLLGYNVILEYYNMVSLEWVSVGCVTSVKTNLTNQASLIPVKDNRDVKGDKNIQVAEMSGDINLSNVMLTDFISVRFFDDMIANKTIYKFRILYGQNIGDRLLEFDAMCVNYSDDDQGVVKYDINLKPDGEIKHGALVKEPDFIFSTNKIGTVNISTNINGTYFTDRLGNALDMPYIRNEGDDNLINMYLPQGNTDADITYI